MRVEETTKGGVKWLVFAKDMTGVEHHLVNITRDGDFYRARCVKGEIVRHNDFIAWSRSVMQAVNETKVYFKFFYPEFKVERK